jgi:hypothetical protein
VKGVLEGKYKSAIFPGMIAAFVTLEGKKECGVGNQNFQYAPGFKEFMLILRSHGRHMYEFVTTHILMMEDRSILWVINPPNVYVILTLHQRKFNKLRIPRFPVTICPQSFDLICDHLAKLAYTGPVGLSCDDTKLSSALQPYWDRDAECHFILGGSGDPIQVPDVESFRELIEEAGVKKATKVCHLYEVRTQCFNVRIALSLVSTGPIS